MHTPIAWSRPLCLTIYRGRKRNLPQGRAGQGREVPRELGGEAN